MATRAPSELIIIWKYHIVLANILFCHQINYILMINAVLSSRYIYALFPPIFLCSKEDHRQFVHFLDVCFQSRAFKSSQNHIRLHILYIIGKMRWQWQWQRHTQRQRRCVSCAELYCYNCVSEWLLYNCGVVVKWKSQKMTAMDHLWHIIA